MERQRLEHEVRTRIRDIMKRMDDISAGVPKGPRTYTDMHGTEHLECIGTYDSEMTRAMARDMFLSHVAIGGRLPELLPPCIMGFRLIRKPPFMKQC